MENIAQMSRVVEQTHNAVSEGETTSPTPPVSEPCGQPSEPPARSRSPLSACIITFNEEHNIRECLESVAWADEIVVVDSFSTDATVDVCRKFTSEVHQREWPGWVAQKNYACSMAQHEWVLSLDADERVTPGLREEIEDVLGAAEIGYDAFAMPRLTWYMGRWIRHGGWYPGRRVRFFRKSKTQWVGDILHERAEVDGPVGRFKGDILHYTYRDFSHHLQTIDRYSTASAEVLFSQGKRCRWFHLILRPPSNAFRKYILQLGILDGVPGLLIALATAMLSLSKYAKLREMWYREGEDPTADSCAKGESH